MPEECLVTYFIGTQVVTINVCDPFEVPCSTRLDHPVGQIDRTLSAVVATSTDGRRVTILDARTSRAVFEHRVTRGEVTSLTARDADLVFLRTSEGGLSVLDPTPALPAPAAGLQLTSDDSSVVYSGVWPGCDSK